MCPSKHQIATLFMIIFRKTKLRERLCDLEGGFCVLASCQYLYIEILATVSENMLNKLTRGATVTGCAPVVSFCYKGLY